MPYYLRAITAVRKSLLQGTLHGVLHVQTGARSVAMAAAAPEMLQMAQ